MKNKITKREIMRVLRTRNETKCFALYMRLHPEAKKLDAEIKRCEVGEFIMQNAPSDSIYNFGESVQTDAFNPHFYTRVAAEWAEIYKHQYYSPRHEVIKWIKEYLINPECVIIRCPCIGRTHLAFRRLMDRNNEDRGWNALPIKGNERFCEVAVKCAEKYINKRLEEYKLKGE